MAMAVANALWVARCARGVERDGLGVLVQFRKLECGVCLRHQGFVLARQLEARCRHGTVVRQHHDMANIGQLATDLLDDRQEIGVHQQHIGVRIIERVQNLRGRQTHVHGEQCCTHHRHTEVRLEVTVAVPVHHRNGALAGDTQACHRVGELGDAAVEITVLVAHFTAIGDLLIAMQTHRIEQQLLDQQRIGVRRGCGREKVVGGLHGSILDSSQINQ